MRENKFKVWCEFMFEGELHKSMEGPESWFLLTQAGTLIVHEPLEPIRPLDKEYIKAIPLFYTGLLDKNGVEIYARDIIKDNCGDIWEVYFDQCSFWKVKGLQTLLLFQNHKLNEYEIIGNIYENPELLKKEER